MYDNRQEINISAIKKIIINVFLLLISAVSIPARGIEEPVEGEPLGGKPPSGMSSSITDYDYQLKYMRAFDLAVWAMPAVSIYGFRRAANAIGAEDNNIIAWSEPADINTEILTPNNTIPYIFSMTDLSKGAVVVEIPPETDKTFLYGQIVDHWQWAIADVGPSGTDKGKGGKYLLLPPDFTGLVPEGYYILNSPSYRVYFAFLAIPENGTSLEEAYNYSKQIKIYYYNDPQPVKFIDPAGKKFSALPRYDENFFIDLYNVFSAEKIRDKDKVMAGYMSYLGMEKNKPYNPDLQTRKAMRQAAADVYYYLQYLQRNPGKDMFYWNDRRWINVLSTDKNGGFSFISGDMMDIDTRADRYFIASYYPHSYHSPPADIIYIYTLRDKNGNLLDGNRMYTLKIPENTPVKQFWSVALYNQETWTFIDNEQEKYGISSLEKEILKKDEDGGITLYFGPHAPEGYENNRIPTGGKNFAVIVRFYGAEKQLISRKWEMPDIEPVE